MERYHVRLGQRRTTVSVDKIVSQYLSLHLGTTPGTLAAHTAVRAWLQSRIDLNNDPGRIRVSQWLLAEALDAIVGPNLREAYACWLDIMISATKSALAVEPIAVSLRSTARGSAANTTSKGSIFDADPGSIFDAD